MKKRVIGAVAVALAGVITAGTILSHVSETAYAQESFVGIDSIIEEHGETNPFTIVELVPDYGLAKLGYFIKGSEPFYYNSETGSYQTWLEHLANLSTAEERRAYMSGLETTLSAISTRFDSEEALEAAKNVTTALSYVPYKESYEAFSGAKTFTLANALTFETDTPGYEMTKVDDGKGTYTLEFVYRLAENDEEGTRYDQNVSSYTTTPTEEGKNYYNLTFAAYDDDKIPAVGEKAYVVDKEKTESVGITGRTDWTDIYYLNDAGVFVKANSTVTGIEESAYYRVIFKQTVVEKQQPAATGGDADAAGSGDGGATNPADTTGTTTDTNTNTDVNGADQAPNGQTPDTTTDPANQTPAVQSDDVIIEENQTPTAASDSTAVIYYQIETDKVTFDETGKGTYGAVLDSETPYKEAEKGHFVCEKNYTQVGEGQGNYTIAESESKKLDGVVHIKQVYYIGNFVNNEIFKQTVFNQSGLLDGEGASDIALQLLVMTPADYMNYEGTTDLLYVSNSSVLVGNAGGLKTYGTGNDLSDMTVDVIYQQVISDAVRLPVILDYSIMSDSRLNGTGVKKLATLLTASDMLSGNVSRTVDDSGSITITVSVEAEFEDTNNDHFYVHDNVLVVPADSSSFSLMKDFDALFLDDNGKSENDFTKDAENIGFKDIADTIIEENTYRTVENEAVGSGTYGLFDQTVSKAIATEYIISFVERREEYKIEGQLRILDVEPCTLYNETNPGPNGENNELVIDNKIKTMLGYSVDGENTENTENAEESDENEPIIIHMSSAEFISKVEDLGEYDMIYFGLYTDHMNTKKDSNNIDRTVYNDSSMDGLVYTNIGDTRNGTFTGGLLDTEFTDTNRANHYALDNLDHSVWSLKSTYSNLTRYSGNDLTSEKVTAIKNFLKSGSPVVLADNFLAKDANGKTYVYDFEYDENGNKVANGYIDNCSRMYELIDEIKDMSNVMTESTASSVVLDRYISLGKPKLTIDAGALVSGQKYYNTNGSKIAFNFSIENFGSADANAKFYCFLYADYNADGRYAAAENVAANDFKITLNGVTQAVKTMTDDDGNEVYYYELSPTDSSTWYRLTYDISENYVGVLPIKLKVSQSTNSYRYDSKQLYFNKINTTGSQVDIKVLQILPESGYNICNLGEKGVYDGNLDPGSEFYKQLHSEAMKDYNITIYAIKAKKYAALYAKDEEFLDDYDMLIIGFADCYGFNMTDKELVAAYQGIGDFIATGKSVLFTHDTTSYSDIPGQEGWAGLMNRLLGADVGFDRYGVFSSNLISAGIKNLTSTSSTVYNVNDYYSLKKAKEEGTLTKDSYTGAELFQMIVDEATANNKDIAYKPNSNKTELVTEVQGRSSMTINGNSGGTYKNSNNAEGTMETKQVELVNEGQILVYPFNILDQMTKEKDGSLTMPVVGTHGQYYQIDMNEDADNDGESDITVWLSLCGKSTQYESVQRDARNNYYIYTKGNVTYSGVGHNNMNQSNNVTEIQLYINTMVTAYSAGVHEPSVSLRQSADPNSAKLSTIYVGMDSKVDAVTGDIDEGEQIDSGTERIYYTIGDTNVMQGGVKKISVQYYLVYDSKDDAPAEYRDIGEELTINDKTVFAVEQHWDTYKGSKTTAETSLDNITTGITYACDVPYDVLKDDEDETTIWVVATTRVWRQGANTTRKPSSTKVAYDYLKVQRIGLFDLD